MSVEIERCGSDRLGSGFAGIELVGDLPAARRLVEAHIADELVLSDQQRGALQLSEEDGSRLHVAELNASFGLHFFRDTLFVEREQRRRFVRTAEDHELRLAVVVDVELLNAIRCRFEFERHGRLAVELMRLPTAVVCTAQGFQRVSRLACGAGFRQVDHFRMLVRVEVGKFQSDRLLAAHRQRLRKRQTTFHHLADTDRLLFCAEHNDLGGSVAVEIGDANLLGPNESGERFPLFETDPLALLEDDHAGGIGVSDDDIGQSVTVEIARRDVA